MQRAGVGSFSILIATTSTMSFIVAFWPQQCGPSPSVPSGGQGGDRNRPVPGLAPSPAPQRHGEGLRPVPC